MKVLIIGSGGREHAFAWKAAQSALVRQIYVAPGNAGTALEPKVQNVAIAATDIEQLCLFAQQQQIDLTLVGPEQPLALGIVDTFQQLGLTIFGPSQAAAQLESSKAFSKAFLKRHAIPTAQYQTFTESQAAIAYVKQRSFPIVIKADGLAAGKGVIIAENLAQAEQTIIDMLSGNAFGQAGCRIVIEDFIEGEEASFIVMCDGKHVIPMASSQDHKRLLDGDHGPNTGGMGAYSPAPIVDEAMHQQIMQNIIYPTLAGMQQDGIPYTGFLYAGLMIDKQGQAKVIEFNCRFGDPETQPIMLRLRSDFVALCLAASQQRLIEQSIDWHPDAALAIVMTAKGYPADYQQRDVITGLTSLTQNERQKVFFAGCQQQDQQFVTTGGRVLCVTTLAATVQQAQQQALMMAAKIHWSGVFYRRDIGYRAIKREMPVY